MGLVEREPCERLDQDHGEFGLQGGKGLSISDAMWVGRFEKCCERVVQLGMAKSWVDVGKARGERRREFDKEGEAILACESFWRL